VGKEKKPREGQVSEPSAPVAEAEDNSKKIAMRTLENFDN
jgi:hypothetical protein